MPLLDFGTFAEGAIGGSLIGLSATSLLLLNGDVLGISGIASAILLDPLKGFSDKSNHWKIVFLCTFAITTNLVISDINALISKGYLAGVTPAVSPLGYAIAGFLVGLGTRLGNGCTTGHGICGLARFSKRSFAAVGTFMGSAIATTVLFVSPQAIFAQYTEFLRTDTQPTTAVTNPYVSYMTSAMAIGYVAYSALYKRIKNDKASSAPPLQDNNLAESTSPPTTTTNTANTTTITPTTEVEHQEANNIRKSGAAALSGALLAKGLSLSNMLVPSKMYGFLDITGLERGTYDPTLMVVMGSGVLVSLLGYQYVEGHSLLQTKAPTVLTRPVAMRRNSGASFNVPSNKIINMELIMGATIFGIGWSMGGLCPGPALSWAAWGVPEALYQWWPSFYMGQRAGVEIKKKLAK
jgi:uncharacterized membrane protein YedE/YeeE